MKILIDLDPGFLARVEREQVVLERTSGKRSPRTAVIRGLLVQAMDARCSSRGEPVPSVVQVEVTEPEPAPATEVPTETGEVEPTRIPPVGEPAA